MNKVSTKKILNIFLLLTFLLNTSPAFSSASDYSWLDNYKEQRRIKKQVNEKKKQEKYDKKNPVNLMPQTYEEYVEQSQDIKKYSQNPATPKYATDLKLTNVDNPKLIVTKYNSPPGAAAINLTSLKKDRQVNSLGVLAAQGDKMAYSAVYYDQTTQKTSSEIYYILTQSEGSFAQKIKSANIAFRVSTPILQSGTEDTDYSKQSILTIIDWSEDGSKIAVKESIGAKDYGNWQTNLWVYDFNLKTATKLNEIREAIKYYWLKNENLNLDNYHWDIVPLGWDTENQDRVILVAFVYTKQKPKFLGEWSIDASGNFSKLISLENAITPISCNGLILQIVK